MPLTKPRSYSPFSYSQFCTTHFEPVLDNMATTANKRVFITGGPGYIGSVITEFAVAQGYEVIGLSRSEKSDIKLRTLGATPVRGDLGSLDVLTLESAKANIVLHLADAFADDFGRDYEEVLRIDAAAVDAIGEGLKGTENSLVVTSGTLVVAPDSNGAETTETSPLSKIPINGRIRAEAHALALCQKGVKVLAVRLAPYVYGRGSSSIRLFMMMSLPAGQVIYVNEGSVRTSSVHVDDAARLFLLVAEKGNAGEVFNATSSTNVTTRQLSEAIASVLDVPVISQTHEETAAKYGEFFAKFLNAENRASSAKAIRELGWEPKEIGILDDITLGSYVAAAQALKRASNS